jgi:fatty-acyl-CoA synthase
VPIVFSHPRVGGSTTDHWGRARELARSADARALISDTAAPATFVGDARCPVLVVAPEGSSGFDVLAPAAVSAQDVAYLQYSSGTTGKPRGAMLTHAAVLQNVSAMHARWGWTSDDCSVGWLPLSHDMGLVCQVIVPALAGSRSVFLQPADWIRSPVDLFRAVAEHRGCMTWMPNFAFKHCLDAIPDEALEGLDLSTWRFVGSGGEIVETSLMRRFAARFSEFGMPPDALVSGYGMSENVVTVASTHFGEPWRSDPVHRVPLLDHGVAEPGEEGQPGVVVVTSSGWALAGTEIAVMDGDGRPCPDRHTGDVFVRGDSLMSGYHRNPDATAAAMIDGWYRTGDLGYLVDGELFVLERHDDMIISQGRNIRPHDVESIARRALGAGNAIAVAFGVHDARKGTQDLVVVCERRKGDDGSHEDVARMLRRDVLAELDVIVSDVRFVERGTIPRTTSGKVGRRASRDRYLSG